MLAMLTAGDPDGEVATGILAKELLREVYAAANEAHARRRLIVFFQHCAGANTRELLRPARSIDRWADQILAYHTTGGASNGKVENLHMLGERTRRAAHGFTNHINYRRRLIARYGIKLATVPTRRNRGHQSRSIA
jgi:transposase